LGTCGGLEPSLPPPRDLRIQLKWGPASELVLTRAGSLKAQEEVGCRPPMRVFLLLAAASAAAAFSPASFILPASHTAAKFGSHAAYSGATPARVELGNGNVQVGPRILGPVTPWRMQMNTESRGARRTETVNHLDTARERALRHLKLSWRPRAAPRSAAPRHRRRRAPHGGFLWRGHHWRRWRRRLCIRR
jgi:hypothetical protein